MHLIAGATGGFAGRIKDGVVAVIEWFWGNGLGPSFFAVFDWLANGVLELGAQVSEFVLGAVPDGVREWLSAPWLSNILTGVHDVSYFVPIGGLLAVVATTLGLVAAIRLVRWIVAMIPTLNL